MSFPFARMHRMTLASLFLGGLLAFPYVLQAQDTKADPVHEGKQAVSSPQGLLSPPGALAKEAAAKMQHGADLVSAAPSQQNPPTEVTPPGGVYSALPPRKWLIDPEHLNSLVFSTWTHALVDEARRGLKARAPTSGELAAGLSSGLEEEKKSPGIREISLSGIAYADSRDWTIWLNGKRVRPDAIPAEILDLRVFKTHIDVKWFDAYSNQVFPVRLRPHQRFNLDTRIFLPG